MFYGYFRQKIGRLILDLTGYYLRLYDNRFDMQKQIDQCSVEFYCHVLIHFFNGYILTIYDQKHAQHLHEVYYLLPVQFGLPSQVE